MRISFTSTFCNLVVIACFASSSVMALGPSLCKDETEALEGCAESSFRTTGTDVLSSCTDQRSDLSECLGAAAPDEPLTGNLTLPPSEGLLSCYFYLTFYDACVAVTNTTGTDCSTSCIIDGPDQNCGDYDYVYCERQECCTACNEYMTQYDICVANAGSCTVSNPECIDSGSSVVMPLYSLTAMGVVGAVLTML
jgi:hypothetical protein